MSYLYEITWVHINVLCTSVLWTVGYAIMVLAGKLVSLVLLYPRFFCVCGSTSNPRALWDSQLCRNFVGDAVIFARISATLLKFYTF